MREDLRYLREKFNLKGIDFIKNIFPNHKVQKSYRHQGFLFLLP